MVEMFLLPEKRALFNFHKCNISERYTGRFDLKIFHIRVPFEKIKNKHLLKHLTNMANLERCHIVFTIRYNPLLI